VERETLLLYRLEVETFALDTTTLIQMMKQAVL